MIERKKYLDKLISRKNNGMVKVITGIRRCGKSYLLFNIYKDHLKSQGISDDQIVELALDEIENIRYRNPIELGEYLSQKTSDDSKNYYVFLDEIQKVVPVQNPYIENAEDKISFVDVVLGLMKHDNIDVYVTGSNSRMLSSDILTEFRGRGDEIRVYPLSFSEFYNAYDGDRHNAWQEYFTYGGMPFIMRKKTHEEKAQYLQNLFDKIYISDIVERNKILHEKSVLDELLNIISSSIGSLTNPSNIAKTFHSVRQIDIDSATVARYLDFFIDSFMISKAERYDVKGRKYIGSPLKYYFSDVGLRNARLNFRQQEENHIMENIIFNELMIRECSVDIGIVYGNEKNAKGRITPVAREIDFIATSGGKKTYIQSAYALGTEEKAITENKPFALTGDSFPKIIVRHDIRKRWYDDSGILNIGVIDFLLDDMLV